jgi:hypothetical protein
MQYLNDIDPLFKIAALAIALITLCLTVGKELAANRKAKARLQEISIQIAQQRAASGAEQMYIHRAAAKEIATKSCFAAARGTLGGAWENERRMILQNYEPVIDANTRKHTAIINRLCFEAEAISASRHTLLKRVCSHIINWRPFVTAKQA